MFQHKVRKKTVKILEMEHMCTSADDVPKKKKKKNIPNPKIRSQSLENPLQSSSSGHCATATYAGILPLHVESEMSITSNDTGSDMYIDGDTIGSEPTVESYLDQGTSSGFPVFPDQQGSHSKKGKSRKSSTSQEFKTNKKDAAKKSEPRKPSAAYVEWSKVQVTKMGEEHPDVDTTRLQEQLMNLWKTVSAKEKMRWHRKSQKMGEATTEAVEVDEEEEKCSQTLHEAVDISARFSLLGESLLLIGARLQEHKGTVSTHECLNILLDSLLCTLGFLISLTKFVPSLGNDLEETQKNIIDQLEHIMLDVG